MSGGESRTPLAWPDILPYARFSKFFAVGQLAYPITAKQQSSPPFHKCEKAHPVRNNTGEERLKIYIWNLRKGLDK